MFIHPNSEHMQFHIYDELEILRGSFSSIYDMERYIDGVRNARGDSFPNTPRMSCFDYIKSIGWQWECIDNYVPSEV